MPKPGLKSLLALVAVGIVGVIAGSPKGVGISAPYVGDAMALTGLVVTFLAVAGIVVWHVSPAIVTAVDRIFRIR